jgi:hypothetical protein
VASFVGDVKDSSGAAVTGAKVTATNQSTGFSRTATTNAEGLYRLDAVPIGVYDVSASLQGFKQTKITSVKLDVAQEARVDLQLEPGDVAASVNVTADPTLLNTESAAIGQVIDNKKIVDLPLNGRDFTQLAALTPGALTNVIPGGPSSGEVTGNSTVSVSGGQGDKTEFLFDGISIQDQLFDGVQLKPSIDFIQEFRVQSNSFSAEYGRGSALINLTSKSGTNQMHGTAFEFFRNDDLDARNFFAAVRAPLRRNQFGAALGGPVKKNKLFYFVNYEGTRLKEPGTTTATVPTAALRSGNFSSVSTPIVDPLTNLPFPNNQIPANRIDPAAAFFLQFVPQPNVGANQYVFNTSLAHNEDQGNARIDWAIGQNDNFFGRYSEDRYNGVNPGSLPTSGGSTQILNAYNGVLSETHIFTPTLLNEARVGYSRMFSDVSPQGLGTNYTTQSGILGFSQTTANFPGFPTISAAGYTAFTNGTPFSPIVNPTNMYEYTDIVTWNRGKHSIRAGIDARHFHFTSTNAAYSRGVFNFNGSFSGNSVADFLLGYPSSGNRDFPRNQFGQKNVDFPLFIQDDYKVTSRLTLNLGLRYDLALAPSQDLGQNSYFNFATGQWIVSTYNGNINLTTQQIAASAYAANAANIVTTKQAGIDNNIQTMSRKNFAPRVGVAWRPLDDDKTVVRGGYGIFYLLDRGNNDVTNGIVNVPFIQDQSLSNSRLANGAPAFTTENLFNVPFTGGALLSATDMHIRPPYSQQWNISVQREVVRSLALQVAYVGNKGTRLEQNFPFNYALPGPGAQNLRRKYPQYGTGDLYTDEGNSIYHALQVSLEKRYSSGLTMLSAFTWSHEIDDLSDSLDSYTGNNPTNQAAEKASGASDIRLRSVTSVSYELPFGRGRTFAGNMPAAADTFLGGWQLATIATFQSGAPFSPTYDGNRANVDVGGNRPNVVGSPDLSDPTIHDWFNVAAFAVPSVYTYGNAGRHVLRGPGFANWDLSMLKNFRFTERISLQFRAEAFNAFNHSQFNQPNGDITSSTAGQITSSRYERNLQLAMKLYF